MKNKDIDKLIIASIAMIVIAFGVPFVITMVTGTNGKPACGLFQSRDCVPR